MPLSVRADDEGDQPGPSRREGLQPEAKGDLAEMRSRKLIRVLATPDDVFYRIQRQDDQGLVPRLAKQLEQQLNRQRQPNQPAIKVVMVPTPTEMQLARLIAGNGDIAVPSLPTISDAGIMSSLPIIENAEPVLVTGDNTNSIDSPNDLIGKKILITAGHPVRDLLQNQKDSWISWSEAPEGITENGLVDLVRVGAVDAVIIERFLAEFWTDTEKNLRWHALPLVTTNPVRKNINMFVRAESKDLLTEINRLLSTPQNDAWLSDIRKKARITTVTNPQELARFQELWPYFKELSAKYELDAHIVAGVAYQESRLRQSARGSGGATGIMQLMPATGQHPAVGGMQIDGSASDNIEAGLRYLRMLSQRFLNDPDIDEHNRSLMVLLAYHRGPPALERAREQARSLGLDDKIWFRNVDQAAARLMGQRPLDYIQNVAKYAWIFSQHTDKPAPALPEVNLREMVAQNEPPLPETKPSFSKDE